MVKGKSSSSSRWLQRQFKDPLVKQSKLDDYRARSAYKLIEIDNKYNFLKRKSTIVDLGACPGAWSQVASQRIGTSQLSNDELVTWNHGMVLAVDKEVIRGLPGVFVIDRADITSSETLKRIYSFLSQRKVDAVISDMAPNATGMHKLDHERIMELANTAFQVAQNCLKTNGTFLCKIFQGSLLNGKQTTLSVMAHCRRGLPLTLYDVGFKHELKTSFESVQEIRCQSTRKESTEVYLLAQQYKED